MKERLYYDIPKEQDKKELIEALKNEFKYNKRIEITNKKNEIIAYTSKYEIYTNYIDLYLNDPIMDNAMTQPGKVQNIEVYIDDFTRKDKKEKRIASIIA